MTRAFILILTLLSLSTSALAEEVDRKPEDVFKGEVKSFKARRITLSYGFDDAKELEDFQVANPFLSPRSGGFRIVGDSLRASGVGALVHKAAFEADVTLEFTLSSSKPQDLGAVLMQPGLTERFLLFSLADTFFSAKDRQKPRQHMVTVVGSEDEKGGAEVAFRYLKRSLTPELTAEKDLEVVVRKLGGKNRFVFGGSYMDADDQERYGLFPEVQPGLFVLKAKMEVDHLTISGKLTEEWLAESGITYDPEERDRAAVREMGRPKGNPKQVGDKATRGGGRRGGWGGGRPAAGGGSAASGEIQKLADTSLTEEAREAAAKTLTKENVKYEELRALRDCLYSEDLLTRTLAIKSLKKVTGKTFGYNPKAPEDARKKAIRKWYQYIMATRDRYR